MTGGNLLKGAELARAIKADVAARAEKLMAEGVTPTLAVVAATNDPAALKYEEAKRRNAEKLGIAYRLETLDPTAAQAGLNARLDALAADPSVHGILLSLPLPDHLDTEEALDRIPAEKDVDGITSANLGRIATGREAAAIPTATPLACIRLIEAHAPLSGTSVTVIGRGRTVGRALIPMLINRHATVTVCHTRTKDLKAAVAPADIVIAAAGRAGLVTADMIASHQMVIDAGMNVAEDGTMTGDAETEAIAAKGARISPVPGGVGPVTSALIFENLLRAIDLQRAGGKVGDPVWDQALGGFLAATASDATTPGGGSVAMVSAALGLGLVLMALDVTAKGKTVPPGLAELRARGGALLERIKGAPHQDIAAFEALMAAYRLPKETEEQKSARAGAIAAATLNATEAPLAAARQCTEGLTLAENAAKLAKAGILSDVDAGARMLRAAGEAVLLNVDINLPGLADEGVRTRCAAARKELARALDQGVERLREALKRRAEG